MPFGTDIRDEQLVGTEAHKNIVGLKLSDIALKALLTTPDLSGGRIPDDTHEGVAILLGISGQPHSQSLEHGIADKEDGLRSGVERRFLHALRLS